MSSISFEFSTIDEQQQMIYQKKNNKWTELTIGNTTLSNQEKVFDEVSHSIEGNPVFEKQIQFTKEEWVICNDEKKLSLVLLRSDTHTIPNIVKCFYWVEDAQQYIQIYENDGTFVTYKNQDNNSEIMNLLQNRLNLGKERYGHGVRINDDTREWGTTEDSWEEMMIEEALDGMIYAAAALLRLKNKKARI